MKFKAVAFDLDGTLYPNHRFYFRLIPFLFRHSPYLMAFGKARSRLRLKSKSKAEDYAMFYKVQAKYMAEIIKPKTTHNSSYIEEIEAKTEKIIYRGWEPLFKKVKLFPYVNETLASIRDKGLKLAILSDFPLKTKLEYLKLEKLWDIELCSEHIGRLKPDPLAFRALCKSLDLPPQDILYVGNSFSYDVIGAKNAGLKTAWIKPKVTRFFPDKKKESQTDFVFFDYRQLNKFVLS